MTDSELVDLKKVLIRNFHLHSPDIYILLQIKDLPLVHLLMSDGLSRNTEIILSDKYPAESRILSLLFDLSTYSSI